MSWRGTWPQNSHGILHSAGASSAQMAAGWQSSCAALRSSPLKPLARMILLQRSRGCSEHSLASRDDGGGDICSTVNTNDVLRGRVLYIIAHTAHSELRTVRTFIHALRTAQSPGESKRCHGNCDEADGNEHTISKPIPSPSSSLRADSPRDAHGVRQRAAAAAARGAVLSVTLRLPPYAPTVARLSERRQRQM